MAKPLLSIGIIFKNDIRCLERCLDSLTPLRKAILCELVMADTGSTDGSRAVAERYADILLDFPWINDFSAARNAVLERCTGKWYLTVDSDEWLDGDFSQLIQFLHSDQADCNDEARVVQRNYSDWELEEYSDFFAARMGNMEHGTLRYHDPIHEFLTYTDRALGERIALPKVILHHDGYLELEPGAVKAKQKRNMARLREELEKNPEDLRTLKHCMDSAEDMAEQRKMVRMSRVAIKKQATTPFHAAIYQACAVFYQKEDDLDALKECLEEWREQMPNAALYRVDGEYLYASLTYQQEQYEEALIHLKCYENGLEDVDSGADLAHSDRLSAMYKFAFPSVRQRAQAMQFHCLCRLERYSEADELLKSPELVEMKPAQKGVLVLKVLEFWPHLQQASAFLRAVWDQAADDLLHAETGKAYSTCQEWANDLATMFKEYWEKHGQNVEGLFLEMGDREPGLSGRILSSDDPVEIAEAWSKTSDFSYMLPEAYLHTMDCRLPMPDGLSGCSSEKLAELVSGLAKAPKFSRTVLDWLTHTPPPETPGALTWQLDLVTAALRTSDWTKDVPLDEGLCAQYANLSSTYLDNVYNPNLLNEEDLSILPGMHRFAWHYRRALSCLEAGDELGYVRALRAGLDTAPAMKDMVDFLVDHIPKPQPAPSPELLALAEQVKAALAQYAPDDPAVLQLKATPAYQSVASLLEDGTSIPAKESPDPVLEDAIRALEKDCTFSNATQAAIALQASYQGVHPDNQKNLADYWAKYPLWGETPDQVFAAAGKTFADHHDDLFWLFGRLADNQSRRVLLAVLSNWRFYDFWKLNAVKETKYDDYFDLDLLHCDDNEVVADLGAYIGDTFLSYVKNYGSLAYKRYYCYEITSDSFTQLAQATKPYPRVILRRKGAGDGPGTMTLSTGSDASANTLTAADDAPQPETTEQETAGETVDIVALDDDITEPLTLIKMDIEGAEQAALRGCTRHIREDRPKLALSVYHNFEDIWKLPRMIEALVPGYRFYLRYHGGKLWATEISLLALPPERK